MNLNSAALKLMAAKGLTLEDVADIVAANEVTRDPTAAERQARCRARKRGHGVTVTRDTPLNESISKPPADPKPSGLAPPQKSDRGARLADDWQLPPEWGEWAKDRRNWTAGDVSEEATLFANYWQSRTGAGATHRDWFKTWQNWVIRSHRKDGEAPRVQRDAKWHRSQAEFFDRIGKPDDAAEHRRKAMSIGRIVSEIARSATA